MLLQESRRPARANAAGDVVVLEEQDRSLWSRELIAEGVARVEEALASRRFGPYTVQAAIAAVHAETPSAAATDWNEIVGLYDVLLRLDPSPVVELNRAVALGMRTCQAVWFRADEDGAASEPDFVAFTQMDVLTVASRLSE